MNKKIVVASIVLALMLVLGCGKSQNSIEQQNSTIYRISITPEEIALTPNGFQQFHAILYDSSNNDITTNESVPLSWDVSGSVGAITQSGTFTATAVGDGQIIASVGSVKGSANIQIIEGIPPSAFNLIITTKEVISPTRIYTISWTTSEAKYNGLKEYQILGCFVSQWEAGNYSVLKRNILPDTTSASVNLMLDGIWEIKVRALDNEEISPPLAARVPYGGRRGECLIKWGYGKA
jgi:hypothetical protein